MATFFLSSCYERRAEMLALAAQIETAGHSVSSRWLLGGHENADGSPPEPWQRAQWAAEDLTDLDRATELVYVSGCGMGCASHPRGGRHVEFGVALALRKIVHLIGPRENIFHHLGWVRRYDTAEIFLEDISLGRVIQECECFTLAYAPDMGQWVNGHHPVCPLTRKEKR
jgi:hypothetical protein